MVCVIPEQEHILFRDGHIRLDIDSLHVGGAYRNRKLLTEICCWYFSRLYESSEQMKKLVLDATDIRILSAVQKHGQLSKTKLAEIVNLSPTPCWARLARLKDAGYITGYRGEIALDRITSFTHVIMTVSLTRHRKADFDRFESYVRSLDEVIDCFATGGGMDYVMTVICPDLASFQDLTDGLLAEEFGIDRYMTYFATRKVKSGVPDLSKMIRNSKR